MPSASGTQSDPQPAPGSWMSRLLDVTALGCHCSLMTDMMSAAESSNDRAVARRWLKNML
jgi:hypothetical protein